MSQDNVPMKAMHHADDRILVVSIVMVVMTGAAVLLRFIIRAKSKASYGADDWWVLASIIFFYVATGLNMWWLVKMRSISSLPPNLPRHIYQVLYASIPFPISTVAASKISVLCLYRRIFPTKTFRRYSFIVGIGVVIYWIVSVLGILLSCVPIQSNWRNVDHKHCIDVNAFFLALELFNCILDIVMLGIALNMVQGLQMRPKQKIAVAVIFLLGGLVLISGIVRMALTYRPRYTGFPSEANTVTALLENALAIICACLPIYGPLLTRAGTAFANQKSWHGLRLSKSGGTEGIELKDHSEPDKHGVSFEQKLNGTEWIEKWPSTEEAQTKFGQWPIISRGSDRPRQNGQC